MEDLLENAPLYQRVLVADHDDWRLSNLSRLPAITTHCLNCNSEHTFNAIKVNEDDPDAYERVVGRNDYNVGNGAIYRLVYLCKMCDVFKKEFLVRFTTEEIEESDDDGDAITYDMVYAAKVGQYPEVSIEVEKPMKVYLDGKNLNIYKKGVISESQGYGIGAFAYYRQVVENQIDNLLDEIQEFTEESQTEELETKVAEAKQKQDTSEKIDIVKDALPTPLRPNGNNILKLMYSALSDGLHNKSDDECLEISQDLRACLVFLVKKIEGRREDEKEFSVAAKALQKKKKKS